MSQYVTKLREEKDEQGQTGRDGIEWPSTVGTWKRGESINRLETFANNLDVSQASGDTDLLNSVPTPWARLLLFENALYKEKHPSHRDVEAQWRGLLGVIALAEPLRLNLRVEGIKLSKLAAENNSGIAKSFSDLSPHDAAADGERERAKWDDFQMIFVDDVALGATSPRTLVFTGVAHQCPPSVPFRSPGGRLSDPVAYYRRFNDTYYLGLLARWIGGLISSLKAEPQVGAWMGEVPAAPGASPAPRMNLLLSRLEAWQRELSDVTPSDVAGGPVSHFTLYPYTHMTSLPRVDRQGASDLFLRGRRDTLVCFRPEAGSRLLNKFGQELVNEPLKVYDGRWIQANQPIPQPLNYLPTGLKYIEDPAALLEDTLIQVLLPDNPDSVYYLALGEKPPAQKRYLFPLKKEVLSYFSTEEIAKNTHISPNPQNHSLRVVFNIPLENDRTVTVTKDYPLDTGVIADTETVTAELGVWPDFACAAWSRYFYCKIKTAGAGRKLLDFEPTVGGDPRTQGNITWYATRVPLHAFVGSVEDKSGLLLLKNRVVEPPPSLWKVSVDFGSTHTRAFSLHVERRGDGKSGYSYVSVHDAEIQPVEFSTRARLLTYADAAAWRDLFFAIIGTADVPKREELRTLLMMPEPTPGTVDTWLPREGFVYTHWILDGDYDPKRLRYNLKWNSDKEDPDLRAYLRCLLVMIQAEAIQQGAQVVSITHTYPSVFTEALAIKHQGEWDDLGNYLNLGGGDANQKVTVEKATITETVAVCRHLEAEQGASPTNNTISLDVGGSTTDMAVWAQKKLMMQESVKLAGGIVGRYLQSPDAQGFLKWLEGVLASAPYNLRLSLSKFGQKPAGYSLMFITLLNWMELHGNLQMLVKQINSSTEARRFMSYIIYLSAGLLYYTGLLARKAGLPQYQNLYQVKFCGKGGTLITWINGYHVLAQEMFEAGLYGPDGRGGSLGAGGVATPKVQPEASKWPKQEVGRGLLADSQLEAGQETERIGLLDPTPPTVTVGETGYEGLRWDGELTPEALMRLPDNTVPPLSELRELNNFLWAFRQGRATKAAAAELNLNNFDSDLFRVELQQRLFGSAKGCIISDIKKSDADALLESLFITEIKVLLESATQNIKMYP
jgi:hypothetical protein